MVTNWRFLVLPSSTSRPSPERSTIVPVTRPIFAQIRSATPRARLCSRSTARSPGRSASGSSGPPRQAIASGVRANRCSPVPWPTPPALLADDRGFREYVTMRSGSLLRTAYLLTGNRADAEDLVQAALAKTFLAWHRIEDRGALDGYARKAMVNTHISWWRRRRLDEFPTDEIPDRVVADHAPGSDLQDTLRRAVDRLPQRMRAAVMLRLLRGHD
jgi:RNA polymerase sigma-70 factor (sigma-E family)